MIAAMETLFVTIEPETDAVDGDGDGEAVCDAWTDVASHETVCDAPINVDSDEEISPSARCVLESPDPAL